MEAKSIIEHDDGRSRKDAVAPRGSMQRVADIELIRSSTRGTVAENAEVDESVIRLNIDYSRFYEMLTSLVRELEKCAVPQPKKTNIPGRVDLWHILPEPDAEKLAGIFKYKRRNCLRNYPDDSKRFPHPDDAGKKSHDKDKKKKGREEKGKTPKSLYSQFWKEFDAVEAMIKNRLIHTEAVHRLVANLPPGINEYSER